MSQPTDDVHTNAYYVVHKGKGSFVGLIEYTASLRVRFAENALDTHSKLIEASCSLLFRTAICGLRSFIVLPISVQQAVQVGSDFLAAGLDLTFFAFSDSTEIP